MQAHNKGLKRVKNSLTGRYTYVSKDRFSGFNTLILFIIAGAVISLLGNAINVQGSTRGSIDEKSQLPPVTTNPTPEPKVKILYSGQVSYYSHEGCIGCGENQITGSGQPFDENSMTLAIPCEDVDLGYNSTGHIKYGTKVKVLNEDTLQQQDAVINDCGGFSKYNRVADLSKGLADSIGAKTDKSNIVIYRYE